MRAKLRQLKQDEFLRNNAVFFVGSLLVAVLNYAYHPLISRLLTVEQFGQVQGYLSISIQLGVISTVFGMVVMNLLNNPDVDAVRSHQSVQATYSFALWFTSGVLVVLLLFVPVLAEIFGLTSWWGWTLVALVVLLGVPRAFGKFHLQSQRRFGLASALELFVSGAKIIFTLLLLWWGNNVLGAIVGYTLAICTGLVILYPYTARTISIKNITWPTLNPALKRELPYAGLILIATGFTTFLYTADILLIRYFFDDNISGQYAGIATIARIIVFGTGSIAGVLLAHVKLQNPTQDNLKVLKKGIFMTLVFGGSVSVLFCIFPERVVSMLMGDKFISMGNLLPLLSIAMLQVSLVNLLVTYTLSLRIYTLIPIIITGCAIIGVLVIFWHTTVPQIVCALIGGLSVVLILIVVKLLRS